MPAPPNAQGPVLEWHQTSRRGAVYAGILMFLVFAVFLTLRDWGIDWMRVWWLWLIAVVGSLAVFLGVRGSPMAAGSDWFLRTRHSWVKTYELVSVRVVKSWGSDELELRDAAGGKTSVSFANVQKNLNLWDLVYNGILHSAYSGRARVSNLARDRLKLPEWLPVKEEDGQTQGTESAAPGRMSRASRVAHIVLAVLSVCAGILVLASVAGFVFSGEAFESGFNIAFLVFLILVGCGFIWGYVWMKRRLER